MAKKRLESKKAPAPVGPYSQAVVAGEFVYVSGQIPLLLSGELIQNNIEKATDIVIDNIEAILKEENLSLEDIVKSEIFLKDLSNFEKFNRIYEKRFAASIKPARVTIEVPKLPKNADIEISCIAYKKKN
ncbi:MAG: Rid family detoxifying hydrolase [Methanofastidiosum sp.]|jgi:2-iminobutanoate/2-iminopropanoate deaminase|nr:Rid family detoxifying hydrolase [Methanofastidiosum sp.]